MCVYVLRQNWSKGEVFPRLLKDRMVAIVIGLVHNILVLFN
jgi:hypothetical protein